MIDFNKDIYIDTFKEEMLKLRQELADIKVAIITVARMLGEFRDTTKELDGNDILIAANMFKWSMKQRERPTLTWDE